MKAGKHILLTSLVLAAFLALVGSERAASRQEATHRVVVTYWEKWTGDEMKAMKSVVDDFNSSQNRIFVKYLSISGIAEKTLLATSGGNPPDVAGLWTDQVVQYADSGALMDMMPLAKEVGLGPDHYIPAYWNQMVYKGGLYALATSPGCAALHVNRKLMPPEYDTAEEFPKTLGEFDRLVERISQRDGKGGFKVAGYLPRQGWGVWPMPYLFGGGYWQEDRIDIAGPDDIEAWTWVNSYAKKFGIKETQSFTAGFGSYNSALNPFISGKLAVMSDGPWFASFIKRNGPDLDWFAVPFPYPDGRPELAGYTMLNLNTLMIPRGAKHPKEAFEFIAYVQRQEVMEKLCTAQMCNSPLAQVSEKFLSMHPNKEIRVFNKLARSPRAVAPLQIGVATQVGREVGIAVDEADLGQKSVEEALKEAQVRVEQAWEKYQRQVLGQ
jgi:ABC-type glycerol-3-phosphate transport system substrate-binding protein